MRRGILVQATLVLALATSLSSVVDGQQHVTMSPGIALGAALSGMRPDRASWAHGRHALATLDLAVATWPVRFRAEAMVVALPQSHGPLSLGASALVPFGSGRLRTYGVVGTGVYGVGGVRQRLGWSAGAGVESPFGAMRVFLEARHHTQTPSAVSLGIRF